MLYPVEWSQLMMHVQYLRMSKYVLMYTDDCLMSLTHMLLDLTLCNGFGKKTNLSHKIKSIQRNIKITNDTLKVC